MYIFIDESGIHTNSGSSAVALVYVMVEDIEKLDKVICDLERHLRISSFHWTKHSWKIRYKFFQGVMEQAFTVKAVILQNPFSQENFETAIGQLLTEEKIKSIIIDGKKSVKYELRLRKVLRQYHISAEKIRMGNDKSFPGLRIADAFAGLVRCYVNDRNNQKAKELYGLAKIKIATLSGGPVSG